MKKIITLLLLAILSGRATAQTGDSTIYISIVDPNALISVAQSGDYVVPIFNNESINTIVNGYTFTVFQQAYPTSRFPYMHQVYKVVANSTQVATDLYTNFPNVFPLYEILPPPTWVYTPVDWEGNYPHPWYVYTWYLDYIYARQAWDQTHGDTSVVIGVTDTYFDTTNPDLQNKIARIDLDVYAYGDYFHGTQVAGRIACATDNIDSTIPGDTVGIGYPSIGFNCRLDLSTDWGDDNEMLIMSQRGTQILNGSWLYAGSPVLNVAAYFPSQGVYDEIYENGTIACFSAGNGAGSGYSPWYFCYPASFDHNISTTSIEGENCTWLAGSTGPCCDCHGYGTDTAAFYQNNTRVDICAPSTRVGGLDYDTSYPTSNPLRYYDHDCNGGNGTSYSSPLTAGTLGLMLSSNKCLTPYQLEWGLKTGSRASIYTVPENAYLWNTSRWDSRLGAGALDADTAVMLVDPLAGGIDCNDPATQTFYVDGIELNTICAPGFSTDSVKPKLIPILENGTPPYTYSWDPIPGNTTTLDNAQSATPTIVAATGSRLAYYRLTVYDASLPQKVANRIIRITLRTDSAYDLAMRDTYMDMLSEPDSSAWVDPRDWNIFYSPDIWNRQYNDGSEAPQNPQYFSGGDPNYMYVRVRNVGCADYPVVDSARLRVYWTLASTGEHWPTDWTWPSSVAGTSGSVIAGAEITDSTTPLIIPLMHPGDTFVTVIPWNPVNPTLYTGSPTSVDVCGLARIIEPLKINKGITFPEIAHTATNVYNDNNIVTRNMTEVDLGRVHRTAEIHRVYVSNTEPGPLVFDVQMIKDRDIQLHFAGNLSEYMYVTVKMDSGLYAAWRNGGSLGNYAGIQQDSSIVYDPATPLLLKGITLQPGDKFHADISFILRDSIGINVPVNNQKMHFRQLIDSNSQVYGDVSYSIYITTDDGSSGRHSAPQQPKTVTTINHYNIYPNPAFDILNIAWSGAKETTADITILDIAGRVISKLQGITMQNGNAELINISNMEPGIYLVYIHDTNGNKQTSKITIIK